MKKLLTCLLVTLSVSAVADRGVIALTNKTNTGANQNIVLKNESGASFCNTRPGQTGRCEVDLFQNYTLSYYDNVRLREVELFRLVSNGLYPIEAVVRQFDERLVSRKFSLTFNSQVLNRLQPYQGGTANYQIFPSHTGNCSTVGFKADDPYSLISCTLRGAETSGVNIAITVLEQ